MLGHRPRQAGRRPPVRRGSGSWEPREPPREIPRQGCLPLRRAPREAFHGLPVPPPWRATWAPCSLGQIAEGIPVAPHEALGDLHGFFEIWVVRSQTKPTGRFREVELIALADAQRLS